MTLAEWVEEEKQRIDRFAAWWRAGDDPVMYPPEMSAGEWDEQYSCWGE